jgi:hypothetical protein
MIEGLSIVKSIVSICIDISILLNESNTIDNIGAYKLQTIDTIDIFYVIGDSNVDNIARIDCFRFFLTGLIPPLLPAHRVSGVGRINSGIPPIDNEQ